MRALLVLTIFLAINLTTRALGEVDKPIVRAVFVPDAPLTGNMNLVIDCGDDFPIMAYLETSAGLRSAVAYNVDGNRIFIPSLKRSASRIVVLLQRAGADSSGGRRLVIADGETISGRWDDSGNTILSDLSNVTDTLSIGEVAVSDTHRVSFNTTDTPLSDSAIIWVVFPRGFSFGVLIDTAYSDNDPGNDGYEPQITSVTHSDQTIRFQLNQGAQQAAPGSRISIRFAIVNNGARAGDYSVVVMTTDSDGNIDNGPAVSLPFTLLPGDLDHIIINPDTSITVRSDSVVNFDVDGYDQYDNLIEGLVFTYAVTVDSCGEVFGSDFRALKVGECYFTAAANGLIDSSGLITVIPGELHRFSLTGYPGQTSAGTPFISPVNVTAYDAHDNVKSDYVGSVWFTSTDPNSSLPHRAPNPYTFTVGDAGSHNFPGSGFILRTSGLKTISVTDGDIIETSNYINVISGVIVSFNLTAGSPQLAGESFQLQVSNARDSLGNLTTGDIIVADSVGGGSSPDGIPPSLNNIDVANGSGSAYQTLTNAVPTVLKGTASGSFAVSATDTIDVVPGNLGRFEMSGHPDSANAGVSFPNPGITVTVFDFFGNPKTNYGDSVYFTSTDPLAVLPYTLLSKYKFQVGDAGSHTFPGTGFTLFSGGFQEVAITDGVLSDTGLIHIYPGPINSFIIYSTDSVTAGIPFMVTASDCRDEWDNLANGTINVTDSVGGGNSPDSTVPIFNSIRVSWGSGAANQTLFNTVTTVLKGYTSTNVIAVTDSIAVVPGAVERFELNISSPQLSGVPFTGTAYVTAIDYFSNIKTNYDALIDTVVISSSGGGTMQNNVLRLSGDFVDGTANLIPMGITYFGRGGNMAFSALSESGASGVSGEVDMRAIFCTGLLIDQGVISWGDTATGVISVVNDGGVAARITDLTVLSETGLVLIPSSTNPPLPDSLDPGINRNYDVRIPIHSGTQQGNHPLTAAARGLFEPYAVGDTLAGWPDTLKIESASQIGYIGGSLSRDTLSTGATYSLSIRLNNTGGAGVGLIDTSYLYFTDGTREFKAALQSGVYIPPNNPVGTVLILDSTLVAANFVEGNYQARFHYFGQENGYFVSDSLDITDIITVENNADIAYIAGSINIDTLVAGQIAVFQVGLTNTGTASFAVDHGLTAIRFSDNQREFAAYSDTSTGTRVDYINQGDTVFYFTPSQLPGEFSPGMYLPTVTMSGQQNGIPQTIVFNTASDSISVISRGSLRIDSTFVMSENFPLVNISQPCSVRVVVSNMGDEAVDSVYLRLSSDGLSSFADSQYFGYIGGHMQRWFNYPVTAGTAPDSGEVFVSSISGGVGIRSGLSPFILSPLDNAAILIIERPADLSLSPISVTWPAGALDDTVSIGQTVTISVIVRNLGQAGISGSRRLILDPGNSGFTIPDSAARDYDIDQNVFWNIIAPLIPNSSSILTTRFVSIPVDVNDGSGAVGPDSVSTIEFVVDTRPSITHTPVVDRPQGARDRVISTNQIFVVADTLSAFGEYRDLTASIDLPYGYATDDSLIKYPSGNIVTWNVRAPMSAGIDSLAVTAWLFDINTGESISTGSDYIRMEAVEAARIGLSTRISGPQAALDNIIEPGGYLEYEALVTNLGEAGVGTGWLSLHIGDQQLVTSDEINRLFTSGTPITWTITAPPSEISYAVPIWVTLDSIPDDENTNAPAPAVNDSSSLFVSVRELLPRLEFIPAGIHSGSVVEGQSLDYLTFALKNNDRGGAFSIGVMRVRLGLSARFGGDTGGNWAVFEEARLFSDTSQIAVGSLTADEIVFDFPAPLLIDPSNSAGIVLKLIISSNTAAIDFTLSMDDGDISGVVFDQGDEIGEIAARSPDGGVLWSGPPAAILARSFAGSISSYPNPFNPRQAPAKIGYYLDSDSEIRVKIFTLMGELVWTIDILASDPLGRAGLHTGDSALPWDGKNDSGHEVHNGVYICIIENVSTGEEERFKIAVVK